MDILARWRRRWPGEPSCVGNWANRFGHGVSQPSSHTLRHSYVQRLVDFGFFLKTRSQHRVDLDELARSTAPAMGVGTVGMTSATPRQHLRRGVLQVRSDEHAVGTDDGEAVGMRVHGMADALKAQRS